MKTNINISNSLNLISEMARENCKFQILEYDDLKGSSDLSSAFMLSYMRNANIKLRQVKITIKNSQVFVESGALSFLRGNIDVTSNTGGVAGLIGKYVTSNLTGETMVKPMFKGNGEILLEPAFNHYVLLELEDKEEIVIDDSMFFAAEGSVKLQTKMIKSLSGIVLGSEALFQTTLTGPGIVCLEVPVPEEEIFKYRLNNDSLKVDGNFAILRSGEIEFSVEKATSSVLGTAFTGEGFLHVYRGTGEVWLMQTKSVYDSLSETENPFERRSAKDVNLSPNENNKK